MSNLINFLESGSIGTEFFLSLNAIHSICFCLYTISTNIAQKFYDDSYISNKGTIVKRLFKGFGMNDFGIFVMKEYVIFATIFYV